MTHAAGIDDRGSGHPISTSSLVPSGSVTKTWTALRLMQLSIDTGLDLDVPVHTILDEWFAKQSPSLPTMLELWGNNTIIETVTIRQLMSMSSGLKDYSDNRMRSCEFLSLLSVLPPHRLPQRYPESRCHWRRLRAAINFNQPDMSAWPPPSLSPRPDPETDDDRLCRERYCRDHDASQRRLPASPVH